MRIRSYVLSFALVVAFFTCASAQSPVLTNVSEDGGSSQNPQGTGGAGVIVQDPPAPAATTSTTFTISASVMSFSTAQQTSPATDLGASFAVTPKLSLRSDNILLPSFNTSAFFGGVQYALPTAKLLGKTNLDPNHFQFYLTGSVGQARVTDSFGELNTHLAALAGGGVNYDPAGTGRFSVNLGEVRWAKIPGLNNSTVIVSSGLKIGF